MRSKILTIIFLAVFAFTLFHVISMRIDIAKKDGELAQIEAEIREQKLKNSEYQAILDDENIDDFYRSIAEDELGYAESDEIIYVDITGY